MLSGSVRKASDSVIKAARLCRGASTARAMISAGEPQDGASGSLADEGGQVPRRLRLWGRRVEEQPAAHQFRSFPGSVRENIRVISPDNGQKGT